MSNKPTQRHQMWLVNPEDVEIAELAVERAQTHVEEVMAALSISAQEARGPDEDFWEEGTFAAMFRPYKVDSAGVLTIPITGMLLNKFPYTMGFITGYEYIEQAMLRGMSDDNVKQINLDVDSGGGMVQGCFELTDKMFEMRGQKPIKAFVEGGAFSAAFSLASSADEIIMGRMAGVGSIGVVTSHTDLSEALEKRGVKKTFIFAGKHKVDGNPFEALPTEVRERVQARINRTYDIFAETVARNRDMTVEAVKSTEALTFTVEEAIENKLADRMGSPSDEKEPGALPFANNGDDSMAKENETATQEANTPAITQADVDSARIEGATAERARFGAVLASASYAGREDLALHLLNTTAMDVASIEATLAVASAQAPEAETPAPSADDDKATGADFNAAMNNSENPEIENVEPKPTPTQDEAAFSMLQAASKQIPDVRS